MNYNINNILRKYEADAFLVFNHEYSGQPITQYLSGFSGSESVIIITSKKKIIFSDGRYYSQAKREARGFVFMPFPRFNHFDLIAETLKKLKIHNFVFDSKITHCEQIIRLKRILPDLKFIEVCNISQAIRIVKNNEEIKKIKNAYNIAIKSFWKIIPFIKSGTTEKELAKKLEISMLESGADKIAFNTIVLSGINGARPHGKPSNKRIKAGEFVTFDFGCFVNGYASDITRTVAIGPLNKDQKKIYNIVKDSQELGCKFAKSGITGHDLDKICRDSIESNGYGKYFLHGTGHGIGMEVHELPYICDMYKEKLLENSIITIEPGIYKEGSFGIRIEDGLVITKNGNINLSSSLTKELLIL